MHEDDRDQMPLSRPLPEEFTSLLSVFLAIIFIVDQRGRIMWASPRVQELLGWTPDELAGKSMEYLVLPHHNGVHINFSRDPEAPPGLQSVGRWGKAIIRNSKGKEIVAEIELAPWDSPMGPVTIVSLRESPSPFKIDVESVREQYLHVQPLTLAERLLSLNGEQDVFITLTEMLRELFPASFVHFWRIDKEERTLILRFKAEDTPSSRPSIDHAVPIDDPQAVIARVARSGQGEVHRHIPQGTEGRMDYQPVVYPSRLWSAAVVPLKAKEGVLGVIILGNLEAPERFSDADFIAMQILAQLATSALSHARLFNTIKENALDLQLLSRVSLNLMKPRSMPGVAEEVVRACVKVLGVDLAWIGRAETDGMIVPIAWWPKNHPYPKEIHVHWDNPVGDQLLPGKAIQARVPKIINDISLEPDLGAGRETLLTHGFKSGAAFPLMSHERAFGVLSLYSGSTGYFNPKRVKTFRMLANQAAVALENARLQEQTQWRLDRILALRNIDLAIASSLDPRLTIRVLLDEVVDKLGVDGAMVLLLDNQSLTLEVAGVRGLSIPHNEMHIRLNQGLVGQVIRERRIVYASLHQVHDPFLSKFLEKEGFVSFHLAPMISKQLVLGVLGVFHRIRHDFQKDFGDFLEALASQAAIAVENSTLFSKIQRSNLDLRMAYEATLEGWAQILELRDQETKGHSQRVVDLTVKLARAIGIKGEELVHVRRGALLHDIGKLAIPDSILLKPGKLTKKEWGVMRRHPQYAFDLLSGIKFLRPALDILYYHHERWDGNGYPRGLKGEEIPIPARIFALVDAWDVMTNDRPYRKALSKEEALTELIKGSGTQFAPEVVDLFLNLSNQGAV